MNRKVFSSMLTLCVAFLLACYVLKFFFPEKFVLFIENEQLLKIGTFVDTHQFVRYICATFTSFITYWLFMCTCKQSWYLDWKECLIVLSFILSARLINFVDSNIASHVSIATFFIIPLICKFNLKIATIVYTVHGLSQVLSLGIRNLPMYMTHINYVSILLCGLETYLWLCLFYILFNYSKGKESKLWDWISRHTTA
jgi:hypothetical protein